jgi:ankyrin repeat protein
MMYAAARQDQVNIVKYCLDHGAVVHPDVMRVLLINRARETYILLLETNAVDVNYYIPWWGDMLSNVARRNDLGWAQLCLDRGADPNQNLVDEHQSILAAVAELASVEMAALLIRYGARVKGSGAIVMAAEEGKLDVVRLLLDKGADINEIGIEHPTDPRFQEDMGSALHRAVEGGHEEVVRFLLDQGADVNLKDVIGRTPLALAETKQNDGIIAVLKERGAR